MIHPNDPQLHWFGMPDFKQEKIEPYAEITLRFDNEKDLQKFCEKTGLKITPKTKSAWYPQKEKSDTGMKRWK